MYIMCFDYTPLSPNLLPYPQSILSQLHVPPFYNALTQIWAAHIYMGMQPSTGARSI